MRRLAASLFVVALASVMAVAPVAGAPSLGIQVDTGAFPKVVISARVSGPTPSPGSFTIRENGNILSGPQAPEVVPISETNTPVGIVLLIDVSGSMKGPKLDAAKAAAKQFVAQRQPNDQIAIVAFNSAPMALSGFTDDAGSLNRAIDGLTASGETALFDGVKIAAALLSKSAALQPNIVLLSDGADSVHRSTVEDAERSVADARATLFAVGLRAGGGEFDAGSLTRLAGSTERYTETADPARLTALYGDIQRDLQNQYEITYSSAVTGGSVQVSVAVAGLRADSDLLHVPAVTQAVNAQPATVKGSPFARLPGGSSGAALIAVVAFLAAALMVISVAALSRRGVPALSTRLRPYGPVGGAAFEATAASGELDLAQTAIVRRAVEATARLVRGRGVLDVLEKKLEQADLPVRPAEALFFYLVGVLAFVVGAGFLGGVFGAAIVLVVVGLAPIATLDALGARRRAAFTSQLPDVLRLLASSLRGGYSLLQAADAAAEQLEDPMGKELRRVLVEARLGRPLEDALNDSARRAQSADYDWAVMAIGIQREVGGNLAELLSTVAETMVGRERIRQEVRTLTAEGRISAVVLTILPLAIGVAVYVLNPGYLDPILHRTSGQLLLFGAIVAALVGLVWMRKIIDIPI